MRTLGLMADIRMSDVSEFQESVNAPAYLGGYSCLIVRAHNGYRPDNMWPGRRDYLRRFPFVALGFYQYVVPDRDAAQQARDFCACVGPLRGNEFVICDLEEGSGDQTPRAEAWLQIVDAHYGMPSTLYAGESFFRDQLGGAARWRARPRWMAAYRVVEPTDPHELWQNTSRAYFPGLPGLVDGNVFHGSPQDFARTMRGGKTPPSPIPPHFQEGDMITAVVKQSGAIEVFIEKASSGEVFHAWQNAPNSAWWGAEPGKQNAKWQSLGTPGK